MVLKFEDYINEGLINKTLKRVRTGGSRIEDKMIIPGSPEFTEYFYNIEWVDLGHPDYLFAKDDYVNGISFNDFENLILPEDVEIINSDLVDWLTFNCDIFKDYIDSDFKTCVIRLISDNKSCIDFYQTPLNKYLYVIDKPRTTQMLVVSIYHYINSMICKLNKYTHDLNSKKIVLKLVKHK